MRRKRREEKRGRLYTSIRQTFGAEGGEVRKDREDEGISNLRTM